MRGEVAGFLLVTLLATHASAELPFPGAIQQAAGIPCAPTCLLCHTAIPGELKNLRQPFGLTVLANGVIPGDPSSMNLVVANLRQKKIDTDKDGKLDVDELAAGTNPNTADPNAELCGPLYGCGAHVAAPPAPGRAPMLCWLASVLGLTLLVGVRRFRSIRRC